ncbi:hypothetical protein EUX98_g171 [Antrodiella citrinella]|uniref:Uncharacterized protein n=1 Tax=Antrodiella citrinella TaxID=2447956 RepID=A0A4S4N510_9APHY|nr:hypothetical protein EUX98_g171 [Antrodiella citrinella]
MMFKFLATALVASTAVVAGPVARAQLDVYNPEITSPVSAQVWAVGTTQLVSWDLSSIPSSQYDKPGMLLLGYLENNSENLDVRHPLATGFDIGAGNVTITVPAVVGRDDYVVALLGDSGNISPEFTITNVTDATSATSTAAAIATSAA